MVKKSCSFLCGVDNMMPDDYCDTNDHNNLNFVSMRWAYPDGSGTLCHVCDRLWESQLCHDHESKVRRHFS